MPLLLSVPEVKQYPFNVDEIDRAILAELQADGRLTVTELAERVRLTPGPCHRRLRELERSAVITGYRAVVDSAAGGMGFEALVQITMERGDADTVGTFESAVADIPQVRNAERLFGDPDYLLRVVAHDLHDYATVRDQRLATLPGVWRLTSTIVMKRNALSRTDRCRSHRDMARTARSAATQRDRNGLTGRDCERTRQHRIRDLFRSATSVALAV